MAAGQAVSMDYPYYQELKRRGHRAARWWMVGDRHNHLGLVGSIACVSCFAPFTGWRSLWGVPVGIAVLFVGVLCKRRSYVLGRRDGINVNDH